MSRQRPKVVEASVGATLNATIKIIIAAASRIPLRRSIDIPDF
jgi:hypothetical protein